MTANPLSTIPPIGPATGMTPPPPTGRFKPIDPIRLLRQHYKLLIVVGVIGLMLGAGLYIGLRRNVPAYTSQAQIEVKGGQEIDPLRAAAAGSGLGSEDAARIMANEANLITSDEIIRDSLLRPRIQASAWYQSHEGDSNKAREDMRNSMLKVNPLRGTTLINLAMTAPTPDEARTLLQEVMDTYIARKRLANEQEGSSLRTLFIGENNRYDDDIRSLRSQMRRFIEDEDLESLGLKTSEEQVLFDLLLKQQHEMSGALTAAQGQYESLRASASSPDITDEENAILQTLPQIASREEEIRALDETRRQLIAGGMKDAHPQIKQLDRRRDSVQFEIDRETEKQLGEIRALQIKTAAKGVEGLMGQMAAIEPQLEETKTKLQELTQKLNEYAALEIDLEIVMEKKQRTDAALDTLRQLSNREDYVRVRIQVFPEEPVLTFPKLIIVPGVSILLLGLVGGLMVLREMLDQRVRSPQDLKLLPVESNLLGLIPHVKEDPSGGGSAERTVERAPTGLLTESYRQVRTAILSKMDRRGYKTLVCVSAQPGSGTSTFIQNLAASLAYNGRNVLIIDANFRRPAQHQLMDCENRLGLVDVLRDDAAVEDMIVAHPDMSLSLLPTGLASDSPPELLEGAAFRGLLGQLETQFDVILIDTPPALLTSDSQMLSKHVDAIAVVVNTGNDKRGMLSRMLSQLDGQRADVLGIVLNGVKASAGGYFRKSYQDFYRYNQAQASDKKTNKKTKKEAAAISPIGNGRLEKDADFDRDPSGDSVVALAESEVEEIDLDLDFPEDETKA
ncbi:MAG: polysaccharide biosynthesis tyrosine autokinase [Planctomycetota bacterium]